MLLTSCMKKFCTVCQLAPLSSERKIPSRPPIQSPPKPSTATAVIWVSSDGGVTEVQVLPPSEVRVAFESDEARTVDFADAIVYQTCPCGSAARVQFLPE